MLSPPVTVIDNHIFEAEPETGCRFPFGGVGAPNGHVPSDTQKHHARAVLLRVRAQALGSDAFLPACVTADAWLDLFGPLLGGPVRRSVNSNKGPFQSWEVGAIFG